MSRPTFGRRGALGVFAAALLPASRLAAQDAVATDWPTKPVHIIVPFAPGGSTDAVILSARIASQTFRRPSTPTILTWSCNPAPSTTARAASAMSSE